LLGDPRGQLLDLLVHSQQDGDHGLATGVIDRFGLGALHVDEFAGRRLCPPTRLNAYRIRPVSGHKCSWNGNYRIEGLIQATALPESPGQYEINPENTSIKIAGIPSTMWGRFALSTPSEEALGLSSQVSPGAPHWYLGSDEWSTLTAGESGAFSTNDGMSFELDTEVFGASVEFTCEGETDIEGSLENPSGGGAGTASASATFGDCVMPGFNGETCEVLPFDSAELSGAATEAGGEPALELTPAEGSEIATFTIVKKEGAPKKCQVTGEYPLEGALIATSGEDGHFDLSASEVTVYSIFPASAGGGFVLEDEAAQTLRLQP
jgi:hypothetical protein